MPTYAYICRNCQRPFDAVSSMEARHRTVSPCCSVLADLDIATAARTVQVNTFNPYTETSIRSAPRIESRRQRDAVLKKHGLTYETNRWGSRKPREHDLTSESLTREILDKVHTAPPQSLAPMTADESQPLRSILPVKINES